LAQVGLPKGRIWKHLLAVAWNKDFAETSYLKIFSFNDNLPHLPAEFCLNCSSINIAAQDIKVTSLAKSSEKIQNYWRLV